MEDFEAIAREREKEINARREQGIIDPRDEKGLIKVEDHKDLGRDLLHPGPNNHKALAEKYILNLDLEI